jgi:WD40 repeat protein
MDAQTGETHIFGRHQADAVMTAFSPDGAYLMSGGWERELICWDVARMQRAFTLGLDSYSLQFSTDGRQCAVFTHSGVQLYAFEPPAAHRDFAEALGSRLRRASFSSDGRWLAASAKDGLGVWNLADNDPGAVTEEGAESYCFFTPDGRELFGSVNKEQAIECFRWRIQPAVNSRAPPALERLPFRKPEGFTFLSLWSNSVVLTATNGSQLLASGAVEARPDRWARTDQGVSGASPDGRWLGIYRPFSTALYVYNLPGLEHVATLTEPTSIGDFQFSPLGDEVAIASRWGVEFLSTQTWKPTRVLTNFNDILYSPDARTMWLTKDLRTGGLYKARTLEPLLMLPTGTLPLALSADGRQLAVSVEMQRLQVWDLAALRAELASLGLEWSPTPP